MNKEYGEHRGKTIKICAYRAYYIINVKVLLTFIVLNGGEYKKIKSKLNK